MRGAGPPVGTLPIDPGIRARSRLGMRGCRPVGWIGEKGPADVSTAP